MAHQQGAELVEGRQPRPPQGEEPVGEEAIRGLVGVGPEPGKLFLEQVGRGQTPVEGEQAAEGFALLAVEVGPPAQQQPALAADEPPRLGPLSEEFCPAGLVQGLTGVAQDVELVAHDLGLGQMLPQAEPEGLPHVDTDGADRPAPGWGQGVGEESVQRLLLALAPDPQWLAGFQVTDHRQELRGLAHEELVRAEVAQRRAHAGGGPAAQRPLVHPPDRLRRQAAVRRDALHRGRLTLLRDGRLQPRRVMDLARHEGQPVGPHPTTATAHAMHFHPQPHRPGSPGQIPEPPLGPAVNLAYRDPAASAHVLWRRGHRPNREGQRVGGFVGVPAVDPIAGQPQNACYDLVGHRLPPVRDGESRQEIYQVWSRCSSSFCPASPRPTVRDDPLRRWSSRPSPDRIAISFDLRSSPWPPSADRPSPGPRAPDTITSSTSLYLRCPAPSNRIATGTPTDSGEERYCRSYSRAMTPSRCSRTSSVATSRSSGRSATATRSNW